MCRDPRCRHITLEEDENGNQTITHFAIGSDNKTYILHIDKYSNPNSGILEKPKRKQTRKRKRRQKSIATMKFRIFI